MKVDVVVVGGGHAGIEATWVSAKRDCRVALITLSKQTIGEMSCNPAIGGQGKGQLVKELDVLGGLMPQVADETGLQFKRLNTKKGPAVWSSRAQSDKVGYARVMQTRLAAEGRIRIVLGEAVDIERRRGGATYDVVLASGERISGACVIVSAGTFLSGQLHIGAYQQKGGRFGECSADRLSRAMTDRFGMAWRRFKTGTPPRVERDSIDIDETLVQWGDAKPMPFSLWSGPIENHIPCYLTHTHSDVHECIVNNIAYAPLFNGQIRSTGPRYCPSIEDKVMRFKERQRHVLFLEPESLENTSVYVNGLATSLPSDVQEQIVAMIPGMSRAQFLRYGYAVEYDCVDPRELSRCLRHREYPGLYFAGQVNGTSGYEEAAVQGLVAGLAASCEVRKEPEPEFERAQSYIGVLLDDITRLGTDEPYRMFTSRCEYRMSVREDNCIERLLPLSRKYGVLSGEQLRECETILEDKTRVWKLAQKEPLQIGGKRCLAKKAIQVDEVDMETFVESAQVSDWARNIRHQHHYVLENLFVEWKYEGYLSKERRSIQRMDRDSGVVIPKDLDFASVVGLSNEARSRLLKHRPQTIGDAKRLFGVTPADILVLLRAVDRWDRRTRQKNVFHVEHPVG